MTPDAPSPSIDTDGSLSVDTDSSSLAERLTAIQERIGQACERAGRDVSTVTLVGVSKAQPLEKLQHAYAAGLRVFGENRVQEAEDKVPAMPEDAEWHMIGPLQSNKIKRAAALFDTIHAVDRLKIARGLDREAAAQNRRLRCFVEVNLGDEESKHGFPARDLFDRVAPLTDLEHLDFIGLMAIPPFDDNPEASRPWFVQLRRLRDDLAAHSAWRDFPGLLSMGMSNDFEVAIAEGATHVRVGTAIFGRRRPPVA